MTRNNDDVYSGTPVEKDSSIPGQTGDLPRGYSGQAPLREQCDIYEVSVTLYYSTLDFNLIVIVEKISYLVNWKLQIV
jgi:hypothetical protein